MFNGIRQHLPASFFTRILPWIILFVAAINVIMIGGKRRSFGIFIAALHENFNTTSKTELNWIGDSYAGLGFFMMPFVTSMILNLNRIYQKAMFAAGIFIFMSCISSSLVPSPGYLFFTHTVLHGIGSSLVLCTTALVTGEYFDKVHRFHVLATTFVSGGPYGVLIFGPMYAAIVANDGWRTAFRIISVPFVIFCFLGAMFFLPINFEYETLDESPEAPTKKKGWAFCSLEHLKKNRQILVYLVERLLHNIVMYGLMMNLTDFVADQLSTSGYSTFELSYTFGIGESLIFTAGAFSGDRLRGYLAFVQMIGAFLSTIMLYIIYYNLKNFAILVWLIGILGACIGIGNTALYATCEEITLLHGSIAFPMTKMFAGIGMLIAPLFSGLAIDIFGYVGFFGLQVILVLVRTLMFVLINIMLMKKKQKKIAELVSEQVEMHQKAAKTNWNNVGDDGFPVNEVPVASSSYQTDEVIREN